MKGWATNYSGERAELASVGARLGARVIDTVLMLVVAIVVTAATRWLVDGDGTSFGFGSRSMYLVLAAVGLFYEVPMVAKNGGQTLGKIESRLHRLGQIDPDTATIPAGRYRLEWLQAFIDQDRTARREIRRLERLIDELADEHGSTLRDEPGIGPIAAGTLLCEVGDLHRFDRESKFARWCGTGIGCSDISGEGQGNPVKHRLDLTTAHAMGLRTLPYLHADPFDRLLVAQSMIEGHTLVTADEKVLAYPISTLTA
ncbi:RDD family protein [Candidatus Poriferisodalis sp.]|uniref:RDD family protein n=1 Tax=Candidatus Poriferisodalis sp. TaxID=3101277 RepID=UPI003B5B4F95